jgi:hypothetical protein
MHRTSLCILAFLTLLSAGCSKTDAIVVLTKGMKKDTYTSTAVPQEFGSFSAASTTMYWVEGTVKNTGAEEAKNLVIAFKCVAGVDSRTLTAEIASIPPGQTVTFTTKPMESRVEVKLKEGEEPEVRFQK